MNPDVVIIGAGPAGLTAAYELSRHGIATTILEKDHIVGGLSRTVVHRGFRFDIGGHRFFTKIPQVRQIWDEILGDDFLERPRLSRIYYRGQFFQYPLRPMEALRGLGLGESAQVVASFLRARMFPSPVEENFEQWVTNRFGRRLFTHFFQTYTEKVWGMPCREIGAEWAAQRIQDLSLGTMLRHALLPDRSGAPARTLIDRFHYPRLGPGMMWERCRDLLRERGHETVTGSAVTRIRHHRDRCTSVTLTGVSGRACELPVSHLISSMPLQDLVRALDPLPPAEVLCAANGLRYRDFLTVSLILDRDELFPDNWIYIHSPEVRVGRIQNFKNWSPEMVPNADQTCLGMEYFVSRGDALWRMPDAALMDLASCEVERLGLARRADVSDGAVVRMTHAYPVYDQEYRLHLATLRAYLRRFANLQTIGRNGQHRYDNQDHSMLTGILAARNVLGEPRDIWGVNADSAYHESGDRAVPRPLAPQVAVEVA
jgi:protoporphyrinogen oxidase